MTKSPSFLVCAFSSCAQNSLKKRGVYEPMKCVMKRPTCYIRERHEEESKAACEGSEEEF